jgi:hypothetical protein
MQHKNTQHIFDFLRHRFHFCDPATRTIDILFGLGYFQLT